MRLIAILCAFILCAFLALPPAALAQLKENADAWPKVRVDGKTCFASHEHYGESRPWVNKKGAVAYAVRQWESFTAWEYGKSWSNYRLATGKRTSCKQASGRWVCSTFARPCRR
jgi:hypothetical protein